MASVSCASGPQAAVHGFAADAEFLGQRGFLRRRPAHTARTPSTARNVRLNSENQTDTRQELHGGLYLDALYAGRVRGVGVPQPDSLVSITSPRFGPGSLGPRLRDPPLHDTCFPFDLTICHATSMTVQIAVKLDDGLAEQVKAAAADAGTNLSEWVRAALQHQALVAKARRARAEEDARDAVYTDEQEAALMAARRRRAIAALDER
jgi:hypothetical protein